MRSSASVAVCGRTAPPECMAIIPPPELGARAADAPALLPHLAQRRGLRVLVQLDVPAHREPFAEAPVMDKEDPVGIDHEHGHGEVDLLVQVRHDVDRHSRDGTQRGARNPAGPPREAAPGRYRIPLPPRRTAGFPRRRYSLGRQPVHFLNVLEKTNGFA